ncbi:MAG: FHA domain-containing protein [Planctomycetes bacterium]|nr:FHA domain-containing protein [Planctomycetota bacterium]
MKLSLVVLTPGKSEGKAIPITLAQFLIGRDPQCNLRPASPMISKRHCAVLVRNGKVFVRDFDSTNGTFINDTQVKEEQQLNHDDILKVGPLEFRVQVEGAPVPVNKPTPTPPPAKIAQQASSNDDDVAAMLLALQDDGPSTPSPSSSDEVPGGTTLMDVLPDAPPETKEEIATEEKKPEAKKPDVKQSQANTSHAAKMILEKYTRRSRS